MKSKKLISLLCAAALTASSFVALAVTASAEDTVLWSNSFDAYPTQGLTAAYHVVEGQKFPSLWLNARKEGNVFTKIINNWNLDPTYAMTANGKTLTVGSYHTSDGALVAGSSNDDNSDDTATTYIIDGGEGNKYLQIPRARFMARHQTGIFGLGDFAANSGEDLLVSFKIKLDTGTAGGATVNPSLRVGNIGEITTEASAGPVDAVDEVKEGDKVVTPAVPAQLAKAHVDADTWTNVRVVIPASGDPAIYLADATSASITTASATLANGLLSVKSNTTEADSVSSYGPYAHIAIDDLTIMSVAAGTGATATVPAATSIDYVAPTSTRELSPSALDTTIPVVTAPTADGTTGKTELDFEDATAGTLVSTNTTADQTSEDKLTGATVTLKKADKSPGGSASIVSTTDGGKALQLSAERFSRKSQAPMFKVSDRKAITSADDPTSVMAFNVMLKDGGSRNGALYLVDNENNVDSNTVIRNGSRMITFATDTNATDTGVSGDIILDAGKWYTVIVTVTPGAGSDTATIEGEIPTTTRIFVYDENGRNIDADAQYQRSAVKNFTRMDAGQSGQHFVQQLPVLIPGGFNTDDIGNGNSRIAVIDNVITYTTTETDFDFGKVLPTPGKSQLVVPEIETEYTAADNTLTVTGTGTFNVNVIHAQYTGDALTNVETQMIEVYEGTGTARLKTQAAAGDKIFIWNSTGNTVPYCNVITVE